MKTFLAIMHHLPTRILITEIWVRIHLSKICILGLPTSFQGPQFCKDLHHQIWPFPLSTLSKASLIGLHLTL